jgi:hypothetical protein
MLKTVVVLLLLFTLVSTSIFEEEEEDDFDGGDWWREVLDELREADRDDDEGRLEQGGDEGDAIRSHGDGNNGEVGKEEDEEDGDEVELKEEGAGDTLRDERERDVEQGGDGGDAIPSTTEESELEQERVDGDSLLRDGGGKKNENVGDGDGVMGGERGDGSEIEDEEARPGGDEKSGGQNGSSDPSSLRDDGPHSRNSKGIESVIPAELGGTLGNGSVVPSNARNDIVHSDIGLSTVSPPEVNLIASSSPPSPPLTSSSKQAEEEKEKLLLLKEADILLREEAMEEEKVKFHFLKQQFENDTVRRMEEQEVINNRLVEEGQQLAKERDLFLSLLEEIDMKKFQLAKEEIEKTKRDEMMEKLRQQYNDVRDRLHQEQLNYIKLNQTMEDERRKLQEDLAAFIIQREEEEGNQTSFIISERGSEGMFVMLDSVECAYPRPGVSTT